MTKNERLEIIAMPSVAYFSGYDGLEIKDIEYGLDDFVVFVTGCWRGGAENQKVHRRKIYYGDESAYFKLDGEKIRLDECIRM